jgi:hypothetical protein
MVYVEYVVAEDEVRKQAKSKWDDGNVEVPIIKENSQSIKFRPNDEKVKKNGNNWKNNIEIILQ